MLIEDFEAYAEAVAALPEPQRSLPAENPEVTAADYFPHCF
jgi:hypothetical protein